MKILFLAHSSIIEGSGRALINILKGLQTYGVEVNVVLPNKKGDLNVSLHQLNIDCFYIPLTTTVYPPLKSRRDILLYLPRLFRLIIKNSISYWKLLALTKKISPDIIHTNTGVVNTGSQIALRTHIPHIWHIREYQELNFGWIPFPTKKNFHRRLHQSNNHLIAITKDVFSHYKMSEKDRVIYDGVISVGQIPVIKEKQKYFLFVGRLEEAKGIEEAIEAFILFAGEFSDYQFLIAASGYPEYTARIKEKVNKTGLSTRIQFLGYRTDVNELMSQATALILSSRFEGFGFVTTEAMYNGCLVIGKNTAGTKEQFDNGLEYCGREIGLRYSTKQDLINMMTALCKNGIEYYTHTIQDAQKNSYKSVFS